MPTRRARIRRRVYARLPRWLRKHDFEVFAAFFGIVAGIPIIFGKVQPGSLEVALNDVVTRVWATALVTGSVLMLVGIIQGSRSKFPERIFWMRMEAVGLTALAYFCYLYTICVMAVNPGGGWTAAAIILAFGLVSHVREAAIQIELEQYRRTLGLREKA